MSNIPPTFLCKHIAIELAARLCGEPHRKALTPPAIWLQLVHIGIRLIQSGARNNLVIGFKMIPGAKVGKVLH